MSLSLNFTTKPSQLAVRVEELRAALKDADPQALAERCGALFTPTTNGGEFRFSYFDKEICVTYPAFAAHDPASGAALPVSVQALLLYYFTTSDGSPAAGQWISFAELPDGRFYNQAFQGYTGDELAHSLGSDALALARAAGKLGGVPTPLGDSAYAFPALPRVPLLLVCWLGDEDFPSTYQILFDAAVRHHLPTDVCAILGSMLTRKLIQAGS